MGEPGGVGGYIAAHAPYPHLFRHLVHKGEQRCHFSAVLRAEGLVEQRVNRLVGGEGLDEIIRAPLQDAYPAERHAQVQVQVAFSAPGRTAGNYTRASRHDGWLVVVKYPGAVAEQLQPELGVGGFPGAAGCREQVRSAVHHHGAGVEHKTAVKQELEVEALCGADYFAVVFVQGGLSGTQAVDGLLRAAHGYQRRRGVVGQVFFRPGGHCREPEIAFHRETADVVLSCHIFLIKTPGAFTRPASCYADVILSADRPDQTQS